MSFPFFASIFKFLMFLETFFKVPIGHLVLEVFLVLLVAILWKAKRFYPKQENIKLTKEEEEQLIKEWTPISLVPDETEEIHRKIPVIDGKLGHYVNVDGNMCLNLATTNFLDLVGNSEFEKKSREIISEYGVGTCGPRGFYGTTDVHLSLEKEIATFCGTEESISYSYGFSTFSSAICAYSKRQDIIFADDGLCFPTQIGVYAARSKVYWFRHNDMSHLEACLEEVNKLYLESPKKFKNVRKFIIVEALYINFGDIVDLKKIVELKYKYQARILMDESYSMGVLGATGRGVTEAQGIDIKDIDMISFSFENSFASVGGACTGPSYIIDHQRLSGLGYVFSASSPTFLCQAARDAITYISNKPEIFKRLSENSHSFITLLKKHLDNRFKIDGVLGSPIIHIRFAQVAFCAKDNLYQNKIIDSIITECIKHQILLMKPVYDKEKEYKLPQPSIRIHLNSALTQEEIKKSVDVISKSVSTAFAS